MKNLRYRQVHLDFHTSECVPSVGDRFNKEQFQAALKAAHIDSITVFSKCHHGWAYHPSTANEMHPKLNFDLLGAQLEACKEIGVNAPVYISAGYDEKYARKNPQHCLKRTPDAGVDFLNKACYKVLCYNTPYLDVLCKQIEEVMEKYNPSGIFLDISSPRVCYCQYCIESMKEKGLDPKNEKDALIHADWVYRNYCEKTEAAVRKYNGETTLFHNGGHIIRGRRDFAHFNTHLELESLPTGGWGYDHFPMSAAYARTLGMEFLGMTGKFHLSWGEFGGYKHPNALRYETALSISQGAKCSIGDQLHPTGEMNMSTYELIGKAYREVEAKEPFIKNAKHISDVAILSIQAFANRQNWWECDSDVGASRILLEGKILFDLIDSESNFEDYKLLILPDEIKIDKALQERIEKYLANGGKLLCSGKSGLKTEKDEFAFDLGVKYNGVNECKPSYMVPRFDAVNGKTAYVMYSELQSVEFDGGKVSAEVEESYFNRTPEHFCSHQQTPNNMGERGVGAVINENCAYIAWNVFEEYAKKGSYHLKELVMDAINHLLPEENRSLLTNLPDRGVCSLTKQENRTVAHLLFAYTSLRGEKTEIIEDTLPVYGIKLSLLSKNQPKRVYKAEYENGEIKETDLEYGFDGKRIDIAVDKVDLHAMVIVE